MARDLRDKRAVLESRARLGALIDEARKP